MSSGKQQVQVISYGDSLSHALLWQKAVSLAPIWAILIIPIVGLVFRSMGSTMMQLGYAVILALCAAYFFEDLLKRKLRMDDEYLFFGFKAIPIKDMVRVDVGYKKRKALPNSLIITRSTGKSLKLSLNGLSESGVETLLKHLQSRNSDLKTAPVLSTLIKCRQVNQKPVLDTAEKLALPYSGRQLLDESVDTFRVTALHWMRMGPLIVCILMGPVWMNFLSLLYTCLQANCWEYLQSIKLHKFLFELFTGVQYAVGMAIQSAATNVQHLAENAILTGVCSLFITGTVLYVYRLLIKPNLLIADSQGIKLLLRLGDIAIPLSRIKWSQITTASLKHSRGSSQSKLCLTKNDSKPFDLSLTALAPEDKSRLLKRIERQAPNCVIDPELSQSMLPKSDRSYTELWLQSLTETPERKTLDPLEPGQMVGENRFQVVRRLGVGGQGTAYLCKQLQSEPASFVVLKETILPIFVENSVRRTSLEKFEQEARLLQSINSNRIVKLLGYFIEDHRSYLVLEHIDGSTLRDMVLTNGPLSAERTCELAIQMCEILKELHSHAVVHRDFTPDNLILNSNGILKLIDFNVAQQLKSGATGTIVGKHAYVPPEQFRGKATMQSDLYAMGASLFFMLTGVDPEPISQSSPASIDTTISGALDDIVKKATALQCDKRYESAEQIEKDLQTLNDAIEAKELKEEVEVKHG